MKTVLITGATSGLGESLAKSFSSEYSVFCIGRNRQKLANLRDLGCQTLEADFLQDDSWIEALEEFCPEVDVLINNAGIFEKHSIEQTTEEIWDTVMNANVRSVQFCIKYAVEALRESKGSIVNIASESGLNGYPFTSAYCASKGAVVNLTRSLAMELAPDIRVNALCPGVVETDMTRAGFAVNGDEAEGIRLQHEAYPLKRIGTLEEAAAATLFLASEEAGFINGVALPMEGGATVGKW